MATPRSGCKERSARCALFTPIPTTGLVFPLREAIRNRFVAEGTVEQFTSAGQLGISPISSYLVVALLQLRHGSLRRRNKCGLSIKRNTHNKVHSGRTGATMRD